MVVVHLVGKKMTKILHNEIQSNVCYKPIRKDPLDNMVLISARSSISVQEGNKCKSRCVTLIIIALGGLILFSFLSISFNPLRHAVHIIQFDGSKSPLSVTSSKYLSVGLDSSVIAENFKKFDMRSYKLRKMMQHISPGYLRIGGTMADRLLFVSDDSVSNKTNFILAQDGDICAYEEKTCNTKLRPNFTMSGTEWLQLNELAAESGFTILFDLNCLKRYENGTWNYTNSEELIDFSNKHNLTVIWQLGNEPNSFKHVFNYEVNATQLAKDFRVLRNILNKYPRYKESLLVGPDVTRPRPENKESVYYLEEFLTNVGHDVVSAVTWHQYYFNGRTATSEDFTNPETFNLLGSQIDTVKSIVSSYGFSDKPVWLTETAAAYGGGAPGYNNRYIGTFIWLDKLGLAAKKGLQVVVRQSIFKGYYALIDNDYEPTPDYWISVLYNTFVGPEVVPCYSAASSRVRLYCQCTNRKFMSSSVTLYGLNMKETDAIIRLQGIKPVEVIYIYILTSHMTLFSKNIFLNNEMLKLGPDGDLPLFKPVEVKGEMYVVMPPFSTAFFVIPSEIDVCKIAGD